MSYHHGKSGVVEVGAQGAGGTNLVARVYDWETVVERPTEDATSMGDSWQEHADGIPGATGSLSCRYDETDTQGQVFLVDQARFDFKLYAIGKGSGKPFQSGTAIMTNVRQAGNYQGIVDASFEFRVVGALVAGVDP